MVFRTGHLGDTVCAIPAFRVLREHFRRGSLTLLCDRPAEGKVASKQVAEMVSAFDWVATYRSGRGPLTFLELLRLLRRAKPDLVVLLPQARETIAGLARKKQFFQICGVKDVRGLLFPKVAHSWQPNEPARLVQMLRRIGIEGGKPAYGIPINPAARASILSKLAGLGVQETSPILVFCGGGKASTQLWDLARYGSVLRSASERLPFTIVAVGTAPELARYQSCILPVFPKLVLLSGLELAEVFELLRLATAYFGNDSGLMHVAAALGRPVAVVMSARNLPGTWDPDVEPCLIFRHRTECEDCFLSECVTERHRCMTSITEETVISELLPFLERLLRVAGAREGLQP
jgi:ADP-heptose:LPS heptosyltransferase